MWVPEEVVLGLKGGVAKQVPIGLFGSRSVLAFVVCFVA